MVAITKLLKKGGSRFKYVETFQVVCDNPKELEAFLSLKTAEQDGMNNENFVHVALTRLPRFQRDCVIKANVSGTLFLKNELKAMTTLRNYPHVVQYICSFECLDDKRRWKRALNTSQFACDPNGKHSITFIVMEYIKYGDVSKLLAKPISKQQIYSLFMQTIFILYELGKVYCILHGDLHTGNILVKKTKQKTITYMGKYNVDIIGYRLVFVDFGRCVRLKKPHSTDHILSDIVLCLDIFRNYIRDRHPNLSERLKPLLHQDVAGVNFHRFIQDITNAFHL